MTRTSKDKACSGSTGNFKTQKFSQDEITNQVNACHNARFSFTEHGQTGNKLYCAQIVTRLRTVGRRKRPEFGPTIDPRIMTTFQITQCCHAIYGTKTHCLDGWNSPFIRHTWLPLVFGSFQSAFKERRFQDMKDV